MHKDNEKRIWQVFKVSEKVTQRVKEKITGIDKR